MFSADFDGPASLWISALDGSRLRKISPRSITAIANTDMEPAWSPDGRQIAYTSITGDSRSSDIWIVQASGAYPVKLIANGASNGSPVWSPNGRKIAFVSDKNDSRDIWTMNADGTQPAKLVSSPGYQSDPSFSPAGDQIVFSKYENGASTLMVVNANGTELRALTTGAFKDWEPSWGVKGIVFTSNRGPDPDERRVWSIQPDGSGLRKVGDVAGSGPVWLPDGRIVFSDRRITSKALNEITIFNPVTGARQVVVDVQGYFTPIDIRPGKPANRINPKSMGKLKVAILSIRTFDATKAVSQASMTFGRTGSENSLVDCSKKFKDVNGDGLPDLTCRFTLRDTGFQAGNTVGVLRFKDRERSIPYEGRDTISTGLEDDSDDFKDED
ncbi:MAG: TolB family protein [Burkholderiales bacterium]|nr:TolB family protein [Burkholderiales bacterium]